MGSFSAGSPAWAAAGLLAAVGAVTAVAGPLLGHWSPSSTWLTMATATAFDLGVILVLELR